MTLYSTYINGQYQFLNCNSSKLNDVGICELMGNTNYSYRYIQPLHLHTLCGNFTIRSSQWYNTLIYFDTGDDSVIDQHCWEWGAIISFLV